MGFGDFAANALSLGAGQVIDALFGGGQLIKAQLVLLKGDASKGEIGIELLEFQFNPEKVTVSDRSSPTRAPTTAGAGETKQGAAKKAREIQFDVTFDTYESREDVRDKYINTLQKMARIDVGLHTTNTLLFCWGMLSMDDDIMFECDLEALTVNYTMFLPDGTPVRATASITLKDVTEPEVEGKKQLSPDHAKLHLVRRGDTLQQIAEHEYDDPGEWRRIADANGIDDPMNLEPGSRLLVPPILR